MASADYDKLKFKPGEVIFSEGEKGDTAYIVQSGTVQVQKKGPEGIEIPLAKIGKGGIFGEMACVDSEPRFASVVAIDNVEVVALGRESFMGRLEKMDKFSALLLTTLIDRLRLQSQKTIEVVVRHRKTVENNRKKVAPGSVKQNLHKLRFETIEGILMDSNPQTRSGLKGGLYQIGLRGLRDIGRIDILSEEIADKFYDILIIDPHDDVKGAAQLMQGVRHGHFGRNPFLCLVGVAQANDAAAAADYFNAGVDEVIYKPYSVDDAMRCVLNMMDDRKPFVVTNDYIGPDRFAQSMASSTAITRFDVPNTLRLKALGLSDRDSLLVDVEAMENRINQEKVERNIVQLAWLIGRIDRDMKNGIDAAPHFGRMSEVLADLAGRADRTPFADYADLCGEMSHLAASARDGTLPDDEMDRFRRLAGSLTGGVSQMKV